jgi:hypothetical protein
VACYHPITGYKSDTGTVKFHEYANSRPINLPCGRCIGCRIKRSKDWALRIVHEASLHPDNCFITLTYSSDHLPPDCGLRKKDFQNFMKALRREYLNKKIRYFHCGEYGDKNNRPHYHAILFNHNFDDWTYLFDSPKGSKIYTSPKLESIWKKGFVTIGEVTYESAAYVARYVLKKINGPMAEMIDDTTGLKKYERINGFTGELVQVIPEYCTMSRRPGIAHGWIDKFTRDMYPKDFTCIRGVQHSSNRYYDSYIKNIDPDMYDNIKQGRKIKGLENKDNSKERLEAREKVAKAKNKLTTRDI